MSVFTCFYPTVSDINIFPDDVLEMVHHADSLPDDPVVTDVMHIFGQLQSVSAICGGYAVFDDVQILQKEGQIRINGQLMNTSGKICSYLKNAGQIAVFTCTAGDGFTKKAGEYNRQGDCLKGYITDTFGSLVVEKAMDYIQTRLEGYALGNGMKITNRYSPGYCNWPVSDQKQLFSLLPDNPCGISLTESCLMLPIKSVSGIIGLGEKVRKSDYACDICGNSQCIYRKVQYS